MNTLFYYDPIFLEHDTGAHPECRARLESIIGRLEKAYGDDLIMNTPRRAGIDEAAAVHARDYLEDVQERCRAGGGFLDADTPVSEQSFEAALHGTGAVLDAARALMEGRTESAFVLARPPGHHARPAAAMGFCLINHVAVAAEALKAQHGLKRVLIVDFDVHHGNGTQEIFYRDGSVFFISMHRFPFYPGTGGSDEKGEGPGQGTTLNLPVVFGTQPEEMLAQFCDALEKSVEEHKPEMILVSAGFDAYAMDPIGGLGLMPEHYLILGRALKKAANRCCGGRLLSSLEGGYSLDGLPLCLEAYATGLE